ncbi:MAG: tetratricopeptide repeat protein [Pseudomonadota bacterium]
MKRIIVAFALVFWTLNLWAAVDAASCNRVVESGQNLNQIYDCIDFYWHDGEYDNPPGSYNNVIILLKKAAAIDPMQYDNFTTAVWLLYSQYVSWEKDPVNNTWGQGKDQEAVAMVMQGRRYHRNYFPYNLETGMHMLNMARFHLPQYYPLAAECFELAYQSAQNDKERIRALLTLGHTHRYQGQKEEAIAQYQRVLQIDPNNKVALNNIRLLGGEKELYYAIR